MFELPNGAGRKGRYGMRKECQYCKHAHKMDAEKEWHIRCNTIHLFEMSRGVCKYYDCDKIPKGEKWTENGETYEYDGYSLEGENYDEVFHCFEPRENGVDTDET